MGLVTILERGRRSVGEAVHMSEISYRYCHFPPAIARIAQSYPHLRLKEAERAVNTIFESMHSRYHRRARQ